LYFGSDAKFHHPLTADGAGKSTRALFAILIKGYLFRVCLFIILCVVAVTWIRWWCLRLQLVLVVYIVLVVLLWFLLFCCILLYCIEYCHLVSVRTTATEWV